MTAVQRRVIQAGVLAVVALACLAELLYIFPIPGGIVWQLELPGGPDVVLGSGYLRSFSLRQWPDVLIEITPGLAFAFSGLIAWSVRPRNRVGLLMMGVGVGLLVGVQPGAKGSPGSPAFSEMLTQILSPWPAIDYPWVSIALSIVGALGVVMLIHLLLAFPGGRLVSSVDRALVRSFYIVVPLATVLGEAALNVSPEALGGAFSSNVFVYAITLPNLIYLGCLVLGSGLVIRRWLLGGRARRRSLAPVFWSVIPVVFAFLPWSVIEIAGGLSLKGTVNASYLDPLPTAAHLSPLLLIALPVGFLIGLLRTGLDMASIGDLVVRLSSGLTPEQLQPALARALQDPSLRVLYWLPTLGWFADLDGKRAELPGLDSERAVSVLGDPTAPVAALVYDSSLVHEGQLLDTAAAAVNMALENARLQVQLRAQLEEVRQSRVRLVEAADSERQRVERDLHDGAQQQLVTLLLSMQTAKTEALKQGDRRVAELIDANISALREALDELRELARGIHPTILSQAGLMPAIQSLADRSPIPVDVKGELGDTRLAPPIEAALYFVVAEAITNAVKHSQGKRMCVQVGRNLGLATIEISDDGVGGADVSRGSGLLGLTDRVAAVGGRLVIRSDAGKGTSINAEVPCG
jgi:signal transduction histidine kinase